MSMNSHMGIQIEFKKLIDVDNRVHNTIVNLCPWGTFYHTTSNLKLIETLTKGQILSMIATYNGRPIGILPFAVQEGMLGRVVMCLPYFGSYGDALLSNGGPDDTEEIMYKTLIRECRKIDSLCLTVITSPFAQESHHDKIRFYLRPDFVDDRNCQITHLPEYLGEDKEGYMSKVQSMMEGRARTAYRKIIKSGFDLRRCESVSEVLEFYRIHEENIGGKGGIFKDEHFFMNAFAMSESNPESAELAVMLDHGKIIAGVVLFYFRETVEYHTTCLLDEYRSIGPLNRIIIDRMVDAGMAGYRYWNFGGTWKTQEGVYKFKQSFGASDHPYYYYTVFFRDLDKIKSMSAQELLSAYPHCFVIPFSELN